MHRLSGNQFKMNKGIIFSVLLLCNSIFLSAQSEKAKADSLLQYVYPINRPGIIMDSLELSFDSILVSAKLYADKVITTNYFQQSKTEIKIEFYLKNHQLIFVRAIEKCPFAEDLNNYTEFYFENCKIFYESNYHSIRMCVINDFSKSIYERYGYNRNLNSYFLKRYAAELFGKISIIGNFGPFI